MPAHHFRLTAALLALAALAFCPGCGEKKEATPAEPQVDLSQSMDIFQHPVPPVVQANPTDVVATVNGKDVTVEAVQGEMVNLMNRLRNRMPPEQLAQMQPRLREQALEQVIAKQLLQEAADRANVEATADDIAAARKKLEEALPPGLSVDDVLKQRNVTVEQFEKEMGAELRINKLLEKVTAEVPEVPESDVKAYYDENQQRFAQPELATARHILIATEPQDAEEAKAAKKAKAEAIRARLLAGEDFATVAEAETDDPGSKRTGGLYGPFPRGQMVPEFDAAVFSQPIGEVGPLVETQFGYHIVKVEKRDEARTVPYDEVHTNLAAFLKSRKLQDAAQVYIDGLRSNAQVSIKQAQ